MEKSKGKSKCCRAEEGIDTYSKSISKMSVCSKCLKPFEPLVTESEDNSVIPDNYPPKSELLGNSEQLEDEFIAFWDSKKESLGLGNYSSDITYWWLNKMNLKSQSIKEKIEGKKLDTTPYGFDFSNCSDERKGYNKAIEDLLAIINSN